MKILKIIFPPALVFTLMAVLLALTFQGPRKSSDKERFVVGLNESEEETINGLREKGFLKSKRIFNLILTLKGWHGKIAPGAYQLSGSSNAYETAEALLAGPYQKWVVILPGRRKEQVALVLREALNWPADLVRSFIMVADEGYLYPDTYLIDVDSDAQEVVDKLKNNFNEKFNTPEGELAKALLAQNVRLDTAVKIASLIERESGGDEDKPIIAGIIWNRLKKGMKLEIDATVQYALTTEDLKLKTKEVTNFWSALPGGLVRKVESPYNTYLHQGLPPDPICSPSIESIRAAAYPAQTDALYYLHSSDKKIHTAKTYKEHQENIEKYLE